MLSWFDMIVCYALTPNIARKRRIDGIDGDGEWLCFDGAQRGNQNSKSRAGLTSQLRK